MAINFEDIKKNFFIEYLKYWIAFFVILFIYILNSKLNYIFGRDEIAKDVENAVYVTTGVAVNEKYVIANKRLIESACIGNLSGRQGSFYVIDTSNIYPAVVDAGDSINNMVLLRLKKNENNLSSYAILQIDTPKYTKNQRSFVPMPINAPGRFDFKTVRTVASNGRDYFIAARGALKKADPVGFPVFSKNYVLQGIVKESSLNYDSRTHRDDVLGKYNIQDTFFVNGVDTIKAFLDKFEIEYSVIGGSANLDNKIYNAKDSVVDVICIKIY